MKCLQERLSFLVLEAFVGWVVHGPLAFLEGRHHIAPGRVSCDVNNAAHVAAFPAVFDDLFLSLGFDGLDLNPMIIGSVRNEDVCFVAVVQNWAEHLPSIVHKPANQAVFVAHVLQRLVGSFRCASRSSRQNSIHGMTVVLN